MKKTFNLNHPKIKMARLIEAAKFDVKKYLKRERNKRLPDGTDFWDFDCKFGHSVEQSKKIHWSEIRQCIDVAENEAWESFYLEILAKPGHRITKPKSISKKAENRDKAVWSPEKPVWPGSPIIKSEKEEENKKFDAEKNAKKKSRLKKKLKHGKRKGKPKRKPRLDPETNEVLPEVSKEKTPEISIKPERRIKKPKLDTTGIKPWDLHKQQPQERKKPVRPMDRLKSDETKPGPWDSLKKPRKTND